MILRYNLQSLKLKYYTQFITTAIKYQINGTAYLLDIHVNCQSDGKMTTQRKSNSKYMQLELRLSWTYFPQITLERLRKKIANAYIFSRETGRPLYETVAGTLGVNDRVKDELKELYTKVIDPLKEFLDSVSLMVKYDFKNVNKGKGARELKVQEFSSLYSRIYRTGGMTGNSNVKNIILYPFLVDVLKTWRKRDEELANRFLSIIKSEEGDPKLKEAIDAMYSSDANPNLLRN